MALTSFVYNRSQESWRTILKTFLQYQVCKSILKTTGVYCSPLPFEKQTLFKVTVRHRGRANTILLGGGVGGGRKRVAYVLSCKSPKTFAETDLKYV